MLFLRISLCLVFGLGINFAAASEILIKEPATVYSQDKQSLQLAAKIDSRRRGDCGVPPDAWTINICEPPPSFCYYAAKQVKLWLPKEQRSKRMDKLEVKKDGNANETVSKRWSASQITVDWPNMIPIEDGVDYLIKLKNWDSSKQVKMNKIEYAPNKNNNETLLKLLKEKGCTPQANMLKSQQS